MPGVGLDLLEIDRLEAALARRPGLAERVFTPGELAGARERPRPARHLAARFCAKEAVVKALELHAPYYRDVEIVGHGRPPSVRLTGAPAERARELGVEVQVSLTHTGTTAGAVALLAPAAGDGAPAR